MGTCPDKFGPYFWGTLHLAALFGDDAPALAQTYLSNLPCPACRAHFKDVLQENPPPKDGAREKVFLWSVDIHNIVNERLGKPKLGYDAAFDKWSKCDNQRAQGGTNWLTLGMFIAILIAVLIFVLRKK